MRSILSEGLRRSKLTIYSETDYLQAHLTTITPDSDPWNLDIGSVRQRLAATLLKWSASATPAISSVLSPLLPHRRDRKN